MLMYSNIKHSQSLQQPGSGWHRVWDQLIGLIVTAVNNAECVGCKLIGIYHPASSNASRWRQIWKSTIMYTKKVQRVKKDKSDFRLFSESKKSQIPPPPPHSAKCVPATRTSEVGSIVTNTCNLVCFFLGPGAVPAAGGLRRSSKKGFCFWTHHANRPLEDFFQERVIILSCGLQSLACVVHFQRNELWRGRIIDIWSMNGNAACRVILWVYMVMCVHWLCIELSSCAPMCPVVQ